MSVSKPDWLSRELADLFEFNFLNGPRSRDQDWRLTKILEVAGSRDEVEVVFASRLHGIHILRIPTDLLDDDLFVASVWDRLEYLA